MVANCERFGPFSRRMLVTAATLALGVSLTAAAQTPAAPQATSDTPTYSSSSASLDTQALLGAAPLALASPQYGGHSNNYPSYPSYQSKWSHIAFVGGGGFSAPVGNDTNGYETWGYNLDVGGGWNFSKKFGILFEYQFDRMKIPGATIAAVGATGGNINSHLFLFDPVYYFYSRNRSGAYVTGGGGFSRKVTNFTDLESTEECYYFCYYGYAPVTVDSFSSTQGALDIGGGMYWKAFGQDSNAKLFAEARYIWVDSPKPTTTTNGEGTEGLVPVTFGIRF